MKGEAAFDDGLSPAVQSFLKNAGPALGGGLGAIGEFQQSGDAGRAAAMGYASYTGSFLGGMIGTAVANTFGVSDRRGQFAIGAAASWATQQVANFIARTVLNS